MARTYISYDKDVKFQSFFERNLFRDTISYFKEGDILLFPISIFNRVISENIIENHNLKKDEYGFPIRKNYINIDCIRNGKFLCIPFHPDFFFYAYEEADEYGCGTNKWIKPSGDVIDHYMEFCKINEKEAFESIGEYGCVEVHMERKKIIEHGTTRARIKLIPHFYFADCSVIKLPSDSLYNEKWYIEACINSILLYYPFRYDEFKTYKDYFYNKKVYWKGLILKNEAIEWDSSWLTLMKNSIKEEKYWGVSRFVDNNAVCWTEKNVELLGVDIWKIACNNCKITWSDKFIEDNIENIPWSRLCKNHHFLWNRERILNFWDYLDFKALLSNPTVAWDYLTFEKVKSQVILDDNIITEIVQEAFIPININNVFEELTSFVKQYREDLSCKSKCVIKGLSKNIAINWTHDILIYAIKMHLIDLEILIQDRASLLVSGSCVGFIELSEEELISYDILHNNPSVGRIPLLNFWNLDRIKKIFKEDVDNMASLVNNPFVMLDEEIIRYYIEKLQSMNYGVYHDIFREISRNEQFYEYIKKNCDNIISEFDRLLKMAER